MRLKGKKALITGASRGIGRGIAEVFADEGADVAVNFVESAEQAQAVADGLKAKGRRAMTVKADVAKRPDVESMIDRAWKELGGLDILVNNAGIETIVPFLELTELLRQRPELHFSDFFCDVASAPRIGGSEIERVAAVAAKCVAHASHPMSGQGRSRFSPRPLIVHARMV